jgi:NADPH-dependent curcumin reductase CurA
MPEMNHQILLANRPDGAASLSNFQSVEVPLGPLAYGEVRVRNHFLSLDPYMRGMMNDTKSYTAPQKLGEVMCGATAGYEGQKLVMANPTLILVSRLRVEGFIVGEHPNDWPVALDELGGLVAGGAIKFRESIAVGLASAPDAFLGLLAGRNFGKQLVRLI